MIFSLGVPEVESVYPNIIDWLKTFQQKNLELNDMLEREVSNFNITEENHINWLQKYQGENLGNSELHAGEREVNNVNIIEDNSIQR